jgi:catechol 2,3-dioxygenase-like lactoylglutathione lyase family enzyme
MNLQMTHTTIYVLNQESAYDFYVNQPGFEVKTDVPLGPGMRWLTVSPKGKNLEIILMPVREGRLFNKQSANKMSELIKSSTLGFGVIKCKDVFAAYEELKSKGVVFKKEPGNSPFGIEAVLCDDSGNWFSLQQSN